ncbi:MAG: hypothetical protein ACXWYF_11830 [Actinomycetota bacterium]
MRGGEPPYVMAQLGHTDAGFTLRVYAHAMRRDEGDKERLKALVEGRHWAPRWFKGRRQTLARRAPKRRNPRGCRGFRRWARRVSNLRPLACEAQGFSYGIPRPASVLWRYSPLSQPPDAGECCAMSPDVGSRIGSLPNWTAAHARVPSEPARVSGRPTATARMASSSVARAWSRVGGSTWVRSFQRARTHVDSRAGDLSRTADAGRSWGMSPRFKQRTRLRLLVEAEPRSRQLPIPPAAQRLPRAALAEMGPGR